MNKNKLIQQTLNLEIKEVGNGSVFKHLKSGKIYIVSSKYEDALLKQWIVNFHHVADKEGEEVIYSNTWEEFKHSFVALNLMKPIDMQGKKKTIEDIKRIRVRMDEVLQFLHEGVFTNNLTMSYEHLRMSRAWLGLVLGDMGQDTPYKQAEKPIQIPQRADKFVFKKENSNSPFKDGLSELEFCNVMRTETQKVKNRIERLKTPAKAKVSKQNALNDLQRAFFYLGFELGDIRDRAIQKRLLGKQ